MKPSKSLGFFELAPISPARLWGLQLSEPSHVIDRYGRAVPRKGEVGTKTERRRMRAKYRRIFKGNQGPGFKAWLRGGVS